MTKAPRPVDNPLIDPPALPHGVPAFDRIRTEHFLPAARYAIDLAREEIAAIRDNPAAPGFENMIEALDAQGLLMSKVYTVFHHLSSVHKEKDLQDIEDEMDAMSVRFGSDVMLDEKIFARVKAVHDDASVRAGLDPEQIMLLDETYKGFVRSGAQLGAAEKTRLRQISERLAKLTTDYANNGKDSAAAWNKVIDAADALRGLPQRVRDTYRELAEEKGHAGKWVIPLSPPPVAVMEYAENRALREEVYRARTAVAWKDAFDNSGIVPEIVALRHEHARMLGHESHAAYVLSDRMAGSVDTVMEFLRKNQEAYMPAAQKDVQAVRDFAKAQDGLDDLKPWDFAFYHRQLQEKTFDFDQEEARAYFDLEKTIRGLFIHAEKLFGIRISETQGQYPVWHPDVKVFEVRDAQSGDMVGVFYGDYYARAGVKKGGAWMNDLRNRGMEEGRDVFPLIANTCNFEKPAKGQPTLLSLDEVRTLFHEFGHGLHGLLARGRYQSLTGTNVKWDFVELPSQLQENWAQEKEVLDTFAVHYGTGEKIPADLVQKIRDMSNFGAGYAGQRQTFLAALDMMWHTTPPEKFTSVEEMEDAVVARSSLFPRLHGPTTTNFSHIFSGGYAAGYYSYKWAEVLDADVFSRFREKGLYDPASAARLRDTIYAQGGTRAPDALFRDMMGRDPDPDALFAREGLAPPAAKKGAAPGNPRPPAP